MQPTNHSFDWISNARVAFAAVTLNEMIETWSQRLPNKYGSISLKLERPEVMPQLCSITSCFSAAQLSLVWDTRVLVCGSIPLKLNITFLDAYDKSLQISVYNWSKYHFQCISCSKLQFWWMANQKYWMVQLLKNIPQKLIL